MYYGRRQEVAWRRKKKKEKERKKRKKEEIRNITAGQYMLVYNCISVADI